MLEHLYILVLQCFNIHVCFTDGDLMSLFTCLCTVKSNNKHKSNPIYLVILKYIKGIERIFLLNLLILKSYLL